LLISTGNKINFGLTCLSSQTVQNFSLHIAKRFLTKDRKINSKAVLKWLLILNTDERLQISGGKERMCPDFTDRGIFLKGGLKQSEKPLELNGVLAANQLVEFFKRYLYPIISRSRNRGHGS
jgi:hypothetical protein